MFQVLRDHRVALGATAVLGGAVLLGGFTLASTAFPSGGGTSAVTADPEATVADDRRIPAVLQKLVDEGVITAEQRDRILQAIEDARPAKAAPVERLVKMTLQEAASAIGITPEQLRQELPGKSLAQVAQAHGVSRDALVQKLTAAVTARIDAAVAESRLTAERAATLKDRLPQAIAHFVDAVHAQRHPLAKRFLGNLLQDAAAAIGITPQQLRQELPGKSLAQVAQAHGVSRDALVQKLTAAVTARIDDAVARNRITAEQAARLKTDLGDRIAASVDREWGERPKR